MFLTSYTETMLCRHFQTEKDILIHDEIDDLARSSDNRLSVWYTVDKAKPGKLFCISRYIAFLVIYDYQIPPKFSHPVDSRQRKTTWHC